MYHKVLRNNESINITFLASVVTSSIVRILKSRTADMVYYLCTNCKTPNKLMESRLKDLVFSNIKSPRPLLVSQRMKDLNLQGRYKESAALFDKSLKDEKGFNTLLQCYIKSCDFDAVRLTVNEMKSRQYRIGVLQLVHR